MSTTEQLTREQWIATTAQLMAGKGHKPDSETRAFAEAMALHHFDEPIAEGSTPESPENALWEEWQAGS